MTDFKSAWEVTNFLKVWPQEVRIALNEGKQLKKYYIFRTCDLENNVLSNSNHYTLPRAISKHDNTSIHYDPLRKAS